MFSTLSNTTVKTSKKAEILGALGSITKCDVSVDTARSQRFELLKHSQEIVSFHRVSNCLNKRIDKDKDIGVMFNPVRSTAQFSNLQRCGSLWACPVCANQISQKRKQELGQAVNAHRKNGGDVVMLTLTTPHQYHDELSMILDMQAMARKRFWQVTAIQNILKSWGCIGHITALEITHGLNGFHPHYHILLFIRSGVDFQKEKSFFYKKWAWACEKSGLGLPSEKHGLDLRDGSHADKYITKWGLADEMTRSVVKVGKSKSNTPFDLLRLSKNGDENARYLFMLYIAGTKGKRQLMWSRGLKSLFNIDDVTDDVIVNETEKVSEEVATLPPLVYYLLVREGARSQYLDLIENDCLNHTSHATDFICAILEKEEKSILAGLEISKKSRADLQDKAQLNQSQYFASQIYLGLVS